MRSNTSRSATTGLPHLRAKVAKLRLAATDHVRAALRALNKHVTPRARLPPILTRENAQLRSRRYRDAVLTDMLSLLALRARHRRACGARDARCGDARRRPEEYVARRVDAVDAFFHGYGVLCLLLLERLLQRRCDELRE